MPAPLRCQQQASVFPKKFFLHQAAFSCVTNK